MENKEKQIKDLSHELEILTLEQKIKKLKKKTEKKSISKIPLPMLLMYCFHVIVIVFGILSFSLIDEEFLFFLILSAVSIAILVLSIIYKLKWLHICCWISNALTLFSAISIIVVNA